jgi:hypothetical protein
MEATMNMRRFGDWRVGRKLAAFVAVVVVAMLTASAATLYLKRESLLTAKREQTRNVVDVAHGILVQSHRLEKSG